MTPQSRIVIIVSLVVCVSAVLAASQLVIPINTERHELQLTFTDDLAKTLPPEYALTSAGLATFRGLAINVLWHRVQALRDEGNYYEAMQVANWITTLQPRFPLVWEFTSWNLAYNVSVTTQTEQERWMWVDAGIRLLRERGIPNNPTSLRLYRQLSWIFLHKVGDLQDDFHFHYKRRLAAQWDIVLGQPPEGSKQVIADWFRPIAEAPRTLSELLTQSPELRPLVDRLAAEGYQPDLGWLTALARERAVASLTILQKPPQRPANVGDPTLPGADPAQFAALLAFARASAIRNEYRMDPAFMLELIEKYGPLDWRTPAAHALYWADLGLVTTEQRLRQKPSDADQINTDRQVLFALQQLVHRGRVIFDPGTGYFNFLPDPRFIDPYDRAFVAVGERDRQARPEDFQAGHQNLLELGIRMAYLYGDRGEAQRLYDRVRQLYAHLNNFERYSKPLSEFVLADFQEAMDGPDDGRQFIAGMIFQAISDGFLNERPETAARFLETARAFHAWFVRTQNDGVRPERRIEIQPFDQMVSDTLTQWLTLPPENVEVLAKAQVWRNLTPELQATLRPRIGRALAEEADRAGLNGTLIYGPFPDPPG